MTVLLTLTLLKLSFPSFMTPISTICEYRIQISYFILYLVIHSSMFFFILNTQLQHSIWRSLQLLKDNHNQWHNPHLALHFSAKCDSRLSGYLNIYSQFYYYDKLDYMDLDMLQIDANRTKRECTKFTVKNYIYVMILYNILYWIQTSA